MIVSSSTITTGCFPCGGETEVLIKDTEISRNQGDLLWDYSSGSDTDTIRITFQGCTFQDNRDMGSPEDWPCVTFVDCDLQSDPIPASAKTAYNDLIERYRALAVDPDAFTDADGAGEQNFLMIAQEMGEGWGYEQ